jgi:site-specific DNA-methyltransferase (cytosine-N4-specific)
MPYRLFPYERRLGIRELEGLGFRELRDDTVSVSGVGDSALAVHRTTYFEAVANGRGADELTQQAAAEAAHLDLRQGPARQATRYGLHGIHEYKGKFNPQVVRALCNIVDVDAELLIDPFCGSGTALIEGLRLGMDVLGVDHSPIACLLARTKLEATTSESKERLAKALDVLGGRVADALERGQETQCSADVVPGLRPAAAAYLKRWFTGPAFNALSNALRVLDEEEPTAVRELARVALSSILRHVSLQLPEDLRIRRRPEPFTAPPMHRLFLEALDGIQRGLLEMGTWPKLTGTWDVVCDTAAVATSYGDARSVKRRLILTSPPYATALPYIDTDRLSLVALGLADADELTSLERSLIGSREWTRVEQLKWDARRVANADGLPLSTTRLVDLIDRLNSGNGAGFRRQAVPSLLYRYFARMGEAIETWRDVLDLGESAVLIVGHNHTKAGGQRVDIPTPDLLGEIAETRGFVMIEIIKLETWPRYGLHAANGVPGEDALVIRRVS